MKLKLLHSAARKRHCLRHFGLLLNGFFISCCKRILEDENA